MQQKSNIFTTTSKPYMEIEGAIENLGKVRDDPGEIFSLLGIVSIITRANQWTGK